MNRKGFTLLEVMVIVIIIGILATLGFINYGGVREKAMEREAQANLKLIRAAERIYYIENNSYLGCATNTLINDNLRLSLSTANTRNWSYVTAVPAVASTFTATATRWVNGAAGTIIWCIDRSIEEPTSGTAGQGGISCAAAAGE